jgi:hypothetical protein
MSANAAATKPVKDPQPSVDRIDDLAKRILTGDIFLPKFQREFVWERQQVLDLLDSVARNYPIGSILLWQSKQELRSESRIADLEIALPKPEYPVNYLLDGQQRLSSICGALYWKGGRADSPWNIAFDLRTKTFHHLDSTEEPAQHLVRLNKLPNPSAFFLQVAALDGAKLPILAANARELFDRFKDYKVATVTLGDMALADVAPIFERINSTGTRLTIVDLMRAATWSPDFDLVDAIDSIREALGAKAFEGIERKAILRNLSAAVGGAFTVESIDDLRKSATEDLKTAVAATEQGYKQAVDFLSTHIRIPSASVVPYSNQIVVLAEILRRLSMPNAPQWAAIERWFWRTGISGYFSGWNSGMMASDLTAVVNFAEGYTPEIEIPMAQPGSQIWTIRPFRLNSAHSKILALILAYEDPRDILTGLAIDTDKALAWQNAKEFHHFFPQSFLKARGVSAAKASALANILYLSSASNKTIGDRPPSDYIGQLIKTHGADARKWLAASLVDGTAIKAALADDYDAFLSARSKTIEERANQLAQWRTAGS